MQFWRGEVSRSVLSSHFLGTEQTQERPERLREMVRTQKRHREVKHRHRSVEHRRGAHRGETQTQAVVDRSGLGPLGLGAPKNR